MRIWWREFWLATAMRSAAFMTATRLVRAVVYRVGTDIPVVHDLTQECFLRAYRNLARLRRPDRFGSWVVGIARAVAREHRRSLRRDRHRFVSDESLDVWTDPDTPGAVQAPTKSRCCCAGFPSFLNASEWLSMCFSFRNATRGKRPSCLDSLDPESMRSSNAP